MSDQEDNKETTKVEITKIPKVKKPNAWIQHVKNVAEKEGISYREALKVGKESYKK
jgi:hypothetical protein